MSTFVYFVAKKVASKGWVLKVSHFRMNNIIIIYIIVIIVVMSEENSLFQNQTEGPVSLGLPRRASKEVLPLWEGLKQRSAPRGNPKAAGFKKWREKNWNH